MVWALPQGTLRSLPASAAKVPDAGEQVNAGRRPKPWGTMAIRLGFCTAPCPDIEPGELCELLRHAGYRAIELCAWTGHPCHPDALTTESAHTLRAQAEDAGLAVSALAAHTTWVLPGPDASWALEYMKRCVDAAVALGAPYVVTGTGPFPRDTDRFAARDALVGALKEAAEAANGSGVVLALEPHVGHMGMTWESVLGLLTTVDADALRVNFGAGHYFALGLDDRAALRQLSAYVVHVHLRDYRRHQRPLCDLQLDPANLEAVALGEGDYDVAGHLDDLDAWGFDGVCSAELFVPDVRAALKRSAQHIQPLLERIG